MKKIIISFLFLLVYVLIFGQDNHYNPEDKINNSEYVFEGIIIKIASYFRNDNIPVFSEIVKVTKVFRGNLIPGTVEIVNFTGGARRERKPYTADQMKKEKVDSLAIFFCKVSKELTYDPAYNIDTVDNKVLLSDYDNNSEDNALSRICRSHYGYSGVPGNHPTKAQAYQYLRKFSNLKIPDKVEPDPVDTTIKTNHVSYYHNPSKHEMDSLARVNNPNAFDSTGKFIGYGNPRITKVKKDTINSK